MASYIVVHTIGGNFNDVATFDEDPDAVIQYAYSDALDAAKAIRRRPGNYARIDRVDEDGTRRIL